MLNMSPPPKYQDWQKETRDFKVLLKLSRSLKLWFIQLWEPSAACFGHNDEDYEDEAHSPDGCYRQHHRCQNVWNGDKKKREKKKMK